MTTKRMRGRVPSREDENIIEAVTDDMGSAMHVALREHFSQAHMKESYWKEAIEAVQAAAEKQVCRILGVKTSRRS